MSEHRYPKPEPPQHHVTRRHRVADFNTLDDLVKHAARELGATHVLHVDDEIHIYFPRRDGTFEKAEVWQKDGYWHAQGPGARAIVQKVPTGAEAIGGGRSGRRATETSMVRSKGFETKRPKTPGWYVLYKDGTFQGPHPGGEQGAKSLARMLSRPDLPVRAVYVDGPGHTVRDYEAVDSRDRHIAGPFKHFGDAKTAAGPGGHVKYVHPRRASEARRRSPKSDALEAGKQYAIDQLQSTNFDDWVYDQMIEAENMRKQDPSKVVPLETEADYKKVARAMLQQLQWDAQRDFVRNPPSEDPEFYEGFREELRSDHARDWLAEMISDIDADIRGIDRRQLPLPGVRDAKRRR